VKHQEFIPLFIKPAVKPVYVFHGLFQGKLFAITFALTEQFYFLVAVDAVKVQRKLLECHLNKADYDVHAAIRPGLKLCIILALVAELSLLLEETEYKARFFLVLVTLHIV
jgi:hypothetical protein